MVNKFRCMYTLTLRGLYNYRIAIYDGLFFKVKRSEVGLEKRYTLASKTVLSITRTTNVVL